jgi:hypothetical protein
MRRAGREACQRSAPSSVLVRFVVRSFSTNSGRPARPCGCACDNRTAPLTETDHDLLQAADMVSSVMPRSLIKVADATMAILADVIPAVLFAQAGGSQEPALLDNVKSVVDIIGTSVTAVALIIGGIWAYFKFVKGRTYRPRLEVELSGQWRLIDGKHLLQAHISVKNIGASVVTLLQNGTGLRVSVLARHQPTAPAQVAWESLRVFEVLVDHAWIEPGETVSDDLLLDLGAASPLPTLFEARLVWRWRKGGNIVVFARKIIPVESAIDQQAESITAAAGDRARRAAHVGLLVERAPAGRGQGRDQEMGRREGGSPEVRG